MPDDGGWELAGHDVESFPVQATCAGAPIWIFKIDEQYRGVQELCPHEQRSLKEARIVGNGTMIRCSYHNYTFKLNSGVGVNCPGNQIAVYEVREEGGNLYVRPAG